MEDDGGDDHKDGADGVRDVESYDVMLCHKKARAGRGVEPYVMCVGPVCANCARCNRCGHIHPCDTGNLKHYTCESKGSIAKLC